LAEDIGHSVTNRTYRGTLKQASPPRQCAMTSSDVTGDPSVTISAVTISPHFSSGMPMTATSRTAGCEVITSSTSMDDTFSPPEMITSFLRSEIVR